MKRREILQRRRYAAVPKATLARTDLSASAKLVYTILIGQLFSEEADKTELSTADIAAKAGLSQRTVRGALRDLEAIELIASHHAPGLPSFYTFPTTDGDDPGRICLPPRQNLPGCPTTNPGKIRRPPRQNPPDPPAESAGPYKEVEHIERSLEPPLPPNGERDDGAPPNQSHDKTDIIETIGQAYLQATGRKLPDNWAAAAQKQLDAGHRAILDEIDAAAITAAHAFADKRGLAFAFGTLLLSIRQTPRKNTAGRDHAVAQAAAARAIAQAGREARQEERDAETKARALVYFRTLSETDRQRWRDQTATRVGIDKCGPEGKELIAASRAYANRHNQQAERKHA